MKVCLKNILQFLAITVQFLKEATVIIGMLKVMVKRNT